MDGGSACRKAGAYTQNKRTQTSMSRGGFEPMFPVFDRTKEVYTLDSTATVIGETKHTNKIQTHGNLCNFHNNNNGNNVFINNNNKSIHIK
jgi:hypothetical protein